MAATLTSFPQPISDEFSTILNTENDTPGAPFFDATLNYLQDQYNKTNSYIGKTIQKKYKLEDEIETSERELETIQTLLIEEYRSRQPYNPETGEKVDPPFRMDGEA